MYATITDARDREAQNVFRGITIKLLAVVRHGTYTLVIFAKLSFVLFCPRALQRDNRRYSHYELRTSS